MVPKPPQCPHCRETRPLWKDTSTTGPKIPDGWRWYCTGCRQVWEPTNDHRARYRAAAAAPPGPGVRAGIR